ncbi:hypothetical protein [Mycobacterium sp.]|uniref:hypothetical protein n=1 Tax=Mycobacterium sp. TaxID=1785 RepID=UPI0031D52D77
MTGGLMIDPQRSACLCDAGLPGHALVTALDEHGTLRPVLAATDQVGDDAVRFDAECHAQAHEQLGLLPPAWVQRVRSVPLRCGRPTLSGTRCRKLVAAPGAACDWHRAGNGL